MGSEFYHTVRDGDCVSSVALANGFFWKTLWEHPNNSELRELRKDPNVLLKGDKVFVPEKIVKEQPGATDKLHQFRVKGQPAIFRIRFVAEDEPRANVRYRFIVDGNVFTGETDADGRIAIPIPPDAHSGVLTLFGDEQEENYKVDLGQMDPVGVAAGARKRLKNLGYDCGDNKETGLAAALRSFQAAQQLEVSGTLDDATQNALLAAHGS